MAKRDNGEKAIDLETLGKSVVSTSQEQGIPVADALILWVAQTADGIEPWGRSVKTRDKQLRDFILTENFLLSALGIICSRNIAFSWTLDGPDRTVKLYQNMLQNANLGRGWGEFIAKVSLDLYTQDMGAYVELIRQSDSATAPVIGINHLDAARCWPTGNAEIPVIYVDREGKYHGLKDHQVCNLHEIPSAFEHPSLGPLYTIQYSAVTRLLKAAQILRNITVYKEEKTGGRFNRAIHLIKGVTAKQIQDAIAQQTAANDLAGLMRYLQPLMVSSVSPDADIGHDTIELATMPDGFSEEITFKNYIAAIAMAFLSDYQEFAPLPGGNLGTSAQSEVLHMKTKGKGPALFKKIITRLMNFQGVLPQNCEFRFMEQDTEEETAQATLRKLRAEERAVRIQSTEITPEVARQLAKDAGDLAPEIFDAMGGLDLTSHITLPDEEKPATPGETSPLGATLQQPAIPPVAPGKQPAPAIGEKFNLSHDAQGRFGSGGSGGGGSVDTRTLSMYERPGAVKAAQEYAKTHGAQIKTEQVTGTDPATGHTAPRHQVLMVAGRYTTPITDTLYPTHAEAQAAGEKRARSSGIRILQTSGAKDFHAIFEQTKELVAELEEMFKADEQHRAGPDEVEAERLDVEQEVKAKALRALQKMQKRIRARLQVEEL